MSELPIILVSGATGKQGGAVIRSLETTRVHIRALTRTTTSPASKALADKGVELAEGSFSDSASLVKALTGVSSAFLVTTPMGEGTEAELKQGKAFIDAAKEASCPHIVFTSVEGAERKSGVPHFESKYQIELYLAASGIPHTIIRPVAFYDNLPKKASLQSFFVMGLFDAALCGKKLQMVAVDDIGWYAARALEDPNKWAGRIIPLAGDNLSMSDVQDSYAAVDGVRPWKAWIPSIMLRLLPYDFRTMLYWFHSEGYKADIAALREEHSGLMTFQQWLKAGKSE